MATAGPSKEECSNCGGSLVKDDSAGMLDILLCQSCGVVASDLDNQIVHTDQQTDQIVLNPVSKLCHLSKQVKGHNSLGQSPYERSLLKWIQTLATKTQLSDSDTTIVRQQGIQLIRNHMWSAKPMHIAAGLIFIALRKTTFTVSFKQMSAITEVPLKCLGRTVKWLQKQPLLCGGEATPLPRYTFKESIQNLIDRLTTDQQMYAIRQQMNTAVPLAVDLKMILDGNLGRSPGWCTSKDGSILVLVLYHIFKDQHQLKVKSWETEIAKLTCVKMITMKNRVTEVKIALYQIASNKLPALESLIKSGTITRSNVNRYLRYFLENKSLLIQERESSKEVVSSHEDSNEPAAPCERVDPSVANFPSLYSKTTRYKHKKLERDSQEDHVTSDDGSGDLFCSDLNDSELSQYLASEKEVKKKENYFEKNHIT